MQTLIRWGASGLERQYASAGQREPRCSAGWIDPKRRQLGGKDAGRSLHPISLVFC